VPLIPLPHHRFEGAEAAHSIISAGPEPLQSQFTTSYSLVLNLLSVYSLDQAREFLRCLGSNYCCSQQRKLLNNLR
jgi:superfamily II RNA helicase